MDAEKAANLGVFLNMEDYRYVADFYDAFHEVTADAIIYFARLLKERYAGKIVGAFYGSYGCTDFFNSSTATSTLPILDCGYVDFLAAPGVYNNREPGGCAAQREYAGFLQAPRADVCGGGGQQDASGGQFLPGCDGAV